MSLTILLKKINYYAEWYQSMSPKERKSDVGKWVKERIGWMVEAVGELKNISKNQVVESVKKPHNGKAGKGRK